MTTLYPGNEPEFYIPDDQLPDKHIVDIKLSPDGEYLSVTGANALSYIYRRNPKTQNSGFYKLDWSCHHSRLAKSVMNFVGFGENELHSKQIVCPINETTVYQYEILEDDTIEFRSALDISQFGYHCIHWLVCYTKLNLETYERTVCIFIIGSHPIDNKGPEQLTPMAEYYVNMSFISHGYDKLFKFVKITQYKSLFPKAPTKHIFLNKREHRVYICSYNYNYNNGTKKYISSVYCLYKSENYLSHCDPINGVYPDEYLYFKDSCNRTQTISYLAHRGIKYGINKLAPSHLDYEISGIKTLGEHYIFQEENDTDTMLHWGDSEYKFTHIKTYKNPEPISLVNFFTLEASCIIKSYIVVHEKVKETKALRLGFIQFIQSPTDKKALQASRFQETITYATAEQQNIPPEIGDIIQSYL